MLAGRVTESMVTQLAGLVRAYAGSREGKGDGAEAGVDDILSKPNYLIDMRAHRYSFKPWPALHAYR